MYVTLVGLTHAAIVMKLLYSSPNSAEVGLVQSFLDSNHIASEIRNDAVSQMIVGAPFSAEIWILREEEYAEAKALIAQFFQTAGS